jgi:hypothetical protein
LRRSWQFAIPYRRPPPARGRTQWKDVTPTIDGWFDRISLDVAPELGTESDFKQRITSVAQEQAIIVASQSAGTVSSAGKLTVSLDSLTGKTIVVQPK